ncbi:MAG TPA: cytochrome c [Draconibacterium sp.]|nr:cytochrome c [Draconibacterium sp.]
MRKKINLLLTAFLCLAIQVSAQDWEVPADQKDIKNPLEYNLANVKKGKELFYQNCKSCHGDPGKNNVLPLVPPPVDIASEKMQKNTEGEIYYKISTGRAGMPQFKATISDDDKWRIVNFIMNFNPDRQPLLVDAPKVKAKLLASVNEQEKKVEVFAEYEVNGAFAILPNAPISISAKKYFGNIKIGDVQTDVNGRAEFKIPESLIGDEEGFVNIVVSLDDNYIAEVVSLNKAKVGQNKQVQKLIQPGILWSTNENIQLWLLFSYIGAVGAAWFAIGYVVFQLFRIKRLSKN